jgi:hypothetical protein
MNASTDRSAELSMSQNRPMVHVCGEGRFFKFFQVEKREKKEEKRESI